MISFSSCLQKKNTSENDLVVFCAASLTDVMSEIIADYENKNQVQVKINLASSGTLARQIEHGAEPSIFISANKKWMDYLHQKKLTVPESEKKIAGNSIVLVAPLKSGLDSFSFSPELNIADMFSGRISLGDPKHVPAGSYALKIIQNLGWLEELEPRFLPAKDVRSALMVVELGEVEAGIVYKTDVLKSKKVKIITEFPGSLDESVSYYITIINGKKNSKSTDLYNYITSDTAKMTLEKYGFIM